MMMAWRLLRIMSQSWMKTRKTLTRREETPPTADDIIFTSLASGALSDVCDVAADMRELDDKESDLVHEFVSQGCSTTCDFGPKKTTLLHALPSQTLSVPPSHLC